MINLGNIKQRINAAQNSFDVEKIFDWDEEEAFLAMPFIITLGTQNSTEGGYVPKFNGGTTATDPNYSPDSYGYFEQIFTGREPILAQWEGLPSTFGSTTIITQDPNSEKYDPNVKRDFAIGRSIRIWAQTTESGTSIGAGGGFSGQTSSRNIIAFTNTIIDEVDEYKLFIIPSLAEDQWLYIKDIQRYYGPDKTYTHSLITFSTVIDALETSGIAIEEYIQRSAPGDAYAWPKVVNDENNVEQVILDTQYLQYRPITDVQIQFYGPTGFSYMSFQARPVYKGEDYHTVRSDRLTVLESLNAPIPDQVSSNVIPENNFYSISGAELSIISQYDNWQQRIGSSYDNFNTKNFEGVLVTDLVSTRASNPTNINWVKPSGNDKTGHWDYSGAGKFPNNIWDKTSLFTLKQGLQLDVAGNGYVCAQLTNGTLPTIGNTSFNVGGTSFTTANWMLLNYMYHNQHQILTIGDQQRTVWSLKDIPLLGWALGSTVVGLPIGWHNTTQDNYIKDTTINIAFSAPMYEWYISSFYDQSVGQNNPGWISLDAFRDSGSTDQVSSIVGAQSSTTIIGGQLTNKITVTNVYDAPTPTPIPTGSKIIDTIWLGQKSEDIPQFPTAYYLYDATTGVSQKDANTQGFVIDMWQFAALAKCDYKITFYSNTGFTSIATQNPVWTGRYVSNSKYADNIRQWTTISKVVDLPNPGFKLPWPLPTPQPSPNFVPTVNPHQPIGLKAQLNQGDLSGYSDYDLTSLYNFTSPNLRQLNILLNTNVENGNWYGEDVSDVATLFKWNNSLTWDIANIPTITSPTQPQIDAMKFAINQTENPSGNFTPEWWVNEVVRNFYNLPSEQTAIPAEPTPPSGCEIQLSEFGYINGFSGGGYAVTQIGFIQMWCFPYIDQGTGNLHLVTSASLLGSTITPATSYFDNNGFSGNKILTIDAIAASYTAVGPTTKTIKVSLAPQNIHLLAGLQDDANNKFAASSPVNISNVIRGQTSGVNADYFDISGTVTWYDANGQIINNDPFQGFFPGLKTNPQQDRPPFTYAGQAPATYKKLLTHNNEDPKVLFNSADDPQISTYASIYPPYHYNNALSAYPYSDASATGIVYKDTNQNSDYMVYLVGGVFQSFDPTKRVCANLTITLDSMNITYTS